MLTEKETQQYCDLMIEFISQKGKRFGANLRKFSEDEIYDYCIQNTKNFQENDNKQIKKLIKNVLSSLIELEYLNYENKTYYITYLISKKKPFLIYDEIEDKINKINNKKSINKLNQMDISYSNDPTMKFGTKAQKETLER